jgi:phosphatidylethanolamine/phosphatidyl-N-methylethanolamine N-methyltransferase
MATAGAQPHESAVYYEFSQFYDAFFGRVFYPRIAKVVRSLGIRARGSACSRSASAPASRSTRIRRTVQVTGIDLAPDMLERAQERIDRNGLRNVTVEQGDALDLRFADDTFDYVTAFHVVSVVPDARRLMAEARRVCRPAGASWSSTTSGARTAAVARLQHSIDPMTRRLGWTTSLYLRDIVDPNGLHVERQWKTSRARSSRS